MDTQGGGYVHILSLVLLKWIPGAFWWSYGDGRHYGNSFVAELK